MKHFWTNISLKIHSYFKHRRRYDVSSLLIESQRTICIFGQCIVYSTRFELYFHFMTEELIQNTRSHSKFSFLRIIYPKCYIDICTTPFLIFTVKLLLFEDIYVYVCTKAWIEKDKLAPFTAFRDRFKRFTPTDSFSSIQNNE